MSASAVGPGGVRNLRAMFENKANNDQSNSPPSRGRSPNGSVSSIPERPLSKVRANFVSVQKPGEESQLQPARRASDITMDGASDYTVVENQGLGPILKGSPFIESGEFPAVPTHNPESNGVADRAAAMVKKMQEGNTNPPPVTTDVDHSAGHKINHTTPRPKQKIPAEATDSPSETHNPASIPRGPIVKPRGGIAKIQGVMASAAKAKEERAAEDCQSKTPVTKPAPTETTKPKDERLSGVHQVKPRGGVPKIQGVIESANKAKEARAANGTEPATKAESSKDAVKSPTTSKPPRSSLPMRKVPAATTAPVSSSVVKKDDAKPAEVKPAEKKTLKAPLRVASTTTASSLAKKSSRASLNNNESAKLRNPPPRPAAEESFLARMMRPTASSAQKTHDKVQAQSPPRPKSTIPGKTLKSRPSRKSLGQADDNKENETGADIPAVPTVPQPTNSQQAETTPTTST